MSGDVAMYFTYVPTPVGRFFLAGSCLRLSIASFSRGHQVRSPEPGWQEDPGKLRFASDQVEEYFAAERTQFELSLALDGTSFQRDVWRTLQEIPFGETRSYGEIAESLGRPGASRAVGAANAANVLPLVVPCHRVIGADGRLTGFGGGLETKQWLLEFEGAGLVEQRSLF